MRGGRLGAVLLGAVCLMAGRAEAWGDEGHELVAMIAYANLDPGPKAKVDALLAADHDTMTASDFASRATWADAWKYSDVPPKKGPHYKHTSQWHFTDLELSAKGQNFDAACFHHPKLPAGVLATDGPDRMCAVDKINQFAAELSNPAIPEAERILALKYVLHLVGDLHQPLHSADDHDSGGNCQQVKATHTGLFHSYWDGDVISDLKPDLSAAFHALNDNLDAQTRADLMKGEPKSWALETYGVAARLAYTPTLRAACVNGKASGVVKIDATYADNARQQAKIQIQRGGLRLAALLNRALK